MKDILIIGSGPAGLTAGIYAKRAGLDAVIAEKDFLSAGAIMSSARVDNYPGLYGISGYNLGDQIRQHAEALRVDFHTAEATGIEKIEGGWRTGFNDGSSIESRTIIYAVGSEEISLNLKGEKSFGRKGIHFCAVCDGPQYRGLTAAVVGGGDTAVDTAIYLAKICDKVHIIHRFAQFEANARSVKSLMEMDNVEMHMETEIASVVIGDNANVDIPAINATNISARVTEKNMVANIVTHTYEVKASINGNTTSLLPGMVAKIRLRAHEQSGFVIPTSCVTLQPSGTMVWLAKDSVAERRAITVGAYTEGGVLVTEGLQLGDKVITDGAHKLYQGAAISYQ